ncbi:methionine adenosyltransferase [candidate division WOR-3 bacterium]|nr:methionine adenosyltransferase [candidate division WOR-3 bacterium]
MKRIITSESVTEGHPDKFCDQVSDAVLDKLLSNDPHPENVRAAIEALATRGVVIVSGEITTSIYIAIPKVVRKLLQDVGYTKAEYHFTDKTCGVITMIQEQSPDIALGVDKGGAGDQGMMFGYATDETKELMPLPIMLAHRLVENLSLKRKSHDNSFLRPDGKSQVSVEYINGIPMRVDTVLISSQHEPQVEREKLKEYIIEEVVKPTIPERLIDANTKYLVNPTGRFVIGGPQADTGVTGRKIMVDTYGGIGKHGGGCFSGKDATKVDRSGAYMARYVAKNLVAAGLAKKVEIQIAYAIGVEKPVSLYIDSFGTGVISDDKLLEAVRNIFDFRPAKIIEHLDLRRPQYRDTACYGHFGRENMGFRWEDTDMVDILKGALQ